MSPSPSTASPSTPPASSLETDAASLRAALWRYLRVLGADAATADDLVQEAFVVALRRRDFDASVTAATFAFLRTTARHLWLKSRRSRPPQRDVDEADRVWDAQCSDGGGDYVDALRRCLAGLPERSRLLLEATYAERRGRTASAAALGIGSQGIKSALRRLRTFLHGCIERRLGGGS
ncbi:MAG TPA: sigma factor [Planctomycetota bacterium]|nr:sigma factor [Planctomycetota bacterium]